MRYAKKEIQSGKAAGWKAVWRYKKYIANENGRSTNKEIEQLIIRYIKEYEKTYGEIEKEDIEYFFKSLG